MDASPTNLQQCGEVGGIQVEHLSLSLSCSMELRNELIWYVVEYVVNGSYDSGVLRTKLIGECRIDFTNISSNDNSTIVVPSFMFKDFLFS